MQTTTPKFQAWLDAENAAQVAERELYEVMLASFRGTSGPPTAEATATARALRKDAHRLFDEAMLEMKQLAQTLQFPQIATKVSSASAKNSYGAVPGQDDAAMV
jgi:hypothetical protein